MNTLQDTLSRYMDAGFPILYLNTFEEEKAEAMIRAVIGGKHVMTWSMLGFVDENESVQMEWDIKDTLLNILQGTVPVDRKVLILKDIHYFFSDPAIVSYVKALAQKITAGDDDFNMIFLSPIVTIPPELEKYITLLTMDYLTLPEIRQTISDFCQEQDIEPLHPALLSELALALKGLSEFEIRNILALAISDDGEITRSDLSLIFEQKQQIIRKSGILEMIPLRESMDDIGGLEKLKQWLQRKEKIFKQLDKAEAFGVDIPKGVLIAGMPGCGKSLNAKAAAKLFGVPLLRLDMGRIMGKYVGESEANMRRAISLAEAISPCVLWIDELEKAFAGIGGEGGGADVTTRLFGTFLKKKKKKDSLAFVVATANDIAKMPPEFLRKGRFDEIFYVGLPNETERHTIFTIHIRKRRPQDLNKIDIDTLVGLTDGYSGADIEGVIKDSIEEVFSQGRNELTTEDIKQAINNTHSLSEIMKDSMDKMEKLYQERKFKNASE